VHDAIGTKALKALLDPTTYVGFAPEIVARVLAAARASGWMTQEPG
jgi:adenylosuccinate lyase